MKNIRSASLALATAASLALLTTACGGDDDGADASSDSSSSSSDSDSGSSDSSSDSATDSGSDTQMDPASDLVGPGCAAYAKQVPSGAGSVEGMSQDPVAVAASNNPLLKTLTAAVSGKVNPKVDLVDTLNGDEFTVFAPVDDAFKQIDAKTMKTLSSPAGAKTLTSILTYHVVPGQLAPDEVAGTHKTAEGEKIKVDGSGDDISVGDGQANVICGGVQTANATVYLIDAVMMPPSMM
ncbi:fasciclin domain-containing protein [Solicola gregarius]|uniref:Fasciclin domain-containing protein n=1 Tax=Solicola gregarius TaxID=2908642 RepID=A0AA46TGW4_9ACTN|nr:fasciclin domain-containing protein [Solicola gregarius]UYM04609.1 fasciclin domain-containing protein [Solicola gregarius]